MATDAGYLEPGEEVVADTAVVALAAPSTRLPELHITEIICKPLQTKQGPPPKMPPPPEKKD